MPLNFSMWTISSAEWHDASLRPSGTRVPLVALPVLGPCEQLAKE